MSFRSFQDDKLQEKEHVLLHRETGKRRSNSTPLLCEMEKRDINALDNKGRTSLFYAAKYGDTEMVRHLLENGADPNIADSSLTFPLHEAVDNVCLEIAALLIDYECDVNCKNLLGQTPLIRAALFGDIETTKLLIKSGADLDDIDNTGKTALLVGLREGNDKLCCHLIRDGCDVNIVDDLGQSALYLSVHRSNGPSLMMCQKLYKAGYDFENDCSWLSKDLYKSITRTGLLSSMLRKLGLQKLKLDHYDFDNVLSNSLSENYLSDSCSRMI